MNKVVPFFFLFMLLLSGCKQEHSSLEDMQDTMTGDVMTGATGQDSMEMEINHADLITGEISFLAEMIPHHQEAIDMSANLITQTQSTGVKLILINVMSGQASEIKTMKNRLSNTYSGSDYISSYMPMKQEVTQDIDIIKTPEHIYMEKMIQHHQGAIDMSIKLLSILAQQDPLITMTKEAAQQRELLKLFAQNIIDTQTKEIAEFQKLLQEY